MSDPQSLITQMRAITISREYGSGGGEIARRLAQRLQWQLVDHELVVRVAHTLGVAEYEILARDEHADSLATRMLCSMRAIDPNMIMATDVLQTSEQAYHQALKSLILALAQERHVVIVGRGSQAILADMLDVLHIRIVAPLEKRITYVVQREGLNRDEARDRINQKERSRERYMQTYHHVNPADSHLYDVVLNTSILDLDGAVDLIYAAMLHKATRLTVPPHELGPAAGASRYPGQPQDFQLPKQK